jgi:hypothetical protein
MNRRTFQNRPLLDEEINQIAPSAFAQQPWYTTSDRYAFVPTSNVIDGMRSAGFLPYSVQQASSRIADKKNFTKHMIRFRPTNVTLAQVGDTAVESILINSHDGTSCYELHLGAFRLACLNGMMVSDGLAEMVRIRHTGNIIQAVVDATSRLIERAPLVVNAIQQWKAIDLKPAEQRILAEEAHSLRFAEGEAAPDVEAILSPRRYADNGNDLWSVFNRVQENLIKGKVKYTVPANVVDGEYVRERRARTRAINGIAQSTNLNKALWSLAEKMAELKTA